MLNIITKSLNKLTISKDIIRNKLKIITPSKMYKGLKKKDRHSNPLELPHQLSSGTINQPTKPILLSNLSFLPDQRKQKKIKGRGRAGRKGRTCGRGAKGQKSRSGTGKPGIGFTGGQTPIFKALPKHHLKLKINKHKPLTLIKLQRWIDLGRLDPSKLITLTHLVKSRCVDNTLDGVELFETGFEHFHTPVQIEVQKATQEAIKSIESMGGNITCRYYSPFNVRVLLYPQRFFKIPKFSLPTNYTDFQYYKNKDNRGYLADSKLEFYAKEEDNAISRLN